MALTFNEKHAMSLIAPQLAPNERVLFRARGVEKPWYSRLFLRLGGLFWRNYLVAATDHRLIFIQYGGLLSGYSAKKANALYHHEIDRVELGWGIFNKNLRVQAGTRNFAKTVVLGRFWMKNNFAGATGMVTTWTQTRGALPGVPQRGALPA
jgi:hypothetical protein